MRRAPLVLTLVLTGCTTPAPSSPVTVTPSSAPPAVAAADYATWDAGRSTPVADKLYPERGNPVLDVLHYDLALAWAPATRTLTGTATLRIRPTTAAPEIILDFTGLTVDKITIDGAAAQGSVAKEKLIVPATLVADQPVTLVVGYHGTPRTVPMPSRRGDSNEGLGMHVTKDGSLWTMQEPWGALTWYPANEHPSDEALYDIAVTVPKGWTGVASGTPGKVTGNTFTYSSADPVASYLVTMAAGKYRKTTAKGPDGVPLTYWTRPGTDDDMLTVLKKSPAALSWLEKRFGKYPFPTGGVLMVDSVSGMETQQMITLGGKVSGKWTEEQATGYESVLVHEYAHQWFGDSITPTTWTDLWLNEGWATYAEYLWQQSQEGFSDADLERFLRESDAKLRKKAGPPGKPNPAYFAESNVYICPATMLKELHDKLGDKAFFALGRDWVQTQRNSHQDRASFIAFVNSKTGKDFTGLINTWLDSKTTPR
ncbi:M1 family metallopeptidase [Actinoplanes sp. NBRC 103695]|uniref:M1 family metallopeptidase n=1 Tax=Actinoplanes sp. NBRC 103695 TaxID=3032202 RepID=UPI0024A0F2A3|nr:M1 family metallopeptidase [Actinoplanes sp. NBRC 103695]GLY99769.1 metallopeptidase [Actinoplanes sp. NBRC 103695]